MDSQLLTFRLKKTDGKCMAGEEDERGVWEAGQSGDEHMGML